MIIFSFLYNLLTISSANAVAERSNELRLYSMDFNVSHATEMGNEYCGVYSHCFPNNTNSIMVAYKFFDYKKAKEDYFQNIITSYMGMNCNSKKRLYSVIFENEVIGYNKPSLTYNRRNASIIVYDNNTICKGLPLNEVIYVNKSIDFSFLVQNASAAITSTDGSIQFYLSIVFLSLIILGYSTMQITSGTYKDQPFSLQNHDYCNVANIQSIALFVFVGLVSLLIFAELFYALTQQIIILHRKFIKKRAVRKKTSPLIRRISNPIPLDRNPYNIEV